MRTVHIILPPNLRASGPFETHNAISYAMFLCEISKSIGYQTYLYGVESENQPQDFIGLIDWAKSLRLNAATEEWPPSTQITRNLTDYYNNAAFIAIRHRLSDDNYIITFSDNSEFLSQHVKNANIIGAKTNPQAAKSDLNLFPSYACMHAAVGAHADNRDICGNHFDSVLHYAPSHENCLVRTKEDYLFFDVRNADEQLVSILANSAGLRCVGVDRTVIGRCEYLDLLSKAKCLILSPLKMDFVGESAIDALSFGTPVISVDWGAASEIVRHGLVGHRCRRLSEYIVAVQDLKGIDPITVRHYFQQRFSLDRAMGKFTEYLDQIADMWSDGFYSQRPPLAARYD